MRILNRKKKISKLSADIANEEVTGCKQIQFRMYELPKKLPNFLLYSEHGAEATRKIMPRFRESGKFYVFAHASFLPRKQAVRRILSSIKGANGLGRIRNGSNLDLTKSRPAR